MKLSAILMPFLTTVASVKACEHVSVEGDATFCIDGPICSGSTLDDGGHKCPKIGDTAVDDCYDYLPSYNAKTDFCTAPVNAECRQIHTGAFGCVWETAAPSTPAVTPAPTPAKTTHAPVATTAKPPATGPTVAPGCEDVSVEGDATFCIMGPVCSGVTLDDGGHKCPQVGDSAVEDCLTNSPSYDPKTGYCTAPVPAVCQQIHTGAFGCVWDLFKLPGNNTTSAPTPKPTPAPTSAPTTAKPTAAPTSAPTTAKPTSAPTSAPTTAKPTTGPTVAPGCVDVSVEGDATFCILGPVCSGITEDDGGHKCPQVGDSAVEDCLTNSPSYDPKTGYCTAPVPAVCQQIKTGTYGCVWDLSKLPKSVATSYAAATGVSGASAAGASTGIIVGAVAAVAAVGIAAVGTIVYRKRTKAMGAASVAEMEVNLSPRSPEFRQI